MRKLIPLLLIAAAACNAAPLMTVTFTPNTLSGVPGDSVQFLGSLTNNTSDTLFINSNSFTFAITGIVDDTPFFTNVPVSLAAGESFGLFEFLSLGIPLGQASGTYDGVFTVQGGITENNYDPIGAAGFHLTVNNTTPEPGSMLLMAAGLVGLVARRRLRQRRQS